MMLLFVDQNLSHDDDTNGLKGKHVAGFLIGTNAGMTPVCALFTIYYENSDADWFFGLTPHALFRVVQKKTTRRRRHR